MARLLVVVLVLLALPSAAAGQVLDCVAPPGTAAIDQYCEQVRPPGRGDEPDALPARPETIARLEVTQAGAAILAATGPYRPAASPASRPSEKAGAAAPGSGAFGAIGRAIGESPTLGAGLLWAGLAILAAMASWFALARRDRAA